MVIEKFNTNEKILIVAELSANHGHDINIAKRTIKAAKESGADAVKIQTYTPDTMTIDCNNVYFTIKNGSIWDGRTFYDLYNEAYTPWDWHRELQQYARELGLIFFSTPFDKSSVDFLEELDVPLYKISSFEIMDTPLIEYVASKNKPVIISTGIASLSDIDEAVRSCHKMNNYNVVLLKCTSEYPAKIQDMNLLTIPNLRDTFNVDVGLSDHTLGHTSAIVSVSLGARIIEKHFILDKAIGGPDSSFSLDPQQFKQLVETVREAEKALGKVNYEIDYKKRNSRKFGRSLFIVQDIKRGEFFTEKNIRSIRPNFGLHPRYINEVIGKEATQDLKRGTPLSWKHIG
jgi:pseudaminic acid synthase